MSGQILWNGTSYFERLSSFANCVEIFRVQELEVVISDFHIIDNCTLRFLSCIFQFQIHTALILVIVPWASVSLFVWVLLYPTVIQRIVITSLESILYCETLARFVLSPSILCREDLIFDSSNSNVLWALINGLCRLTVIVHHDLPQLAIQISLLASLFSFPWRRARPEEKVYVFLSFWLHYESGCLANVPSSFFKFLVSLFCEGMDLDLLFSVDLVVDWGLWKLHRCFIASQRRERCLIRLHMLEEFLSLFLLLVNYLVGLALIHAHLISSLRTVPIRGNSWPIIMGNAEVRSVGIVEPNHLGRLVPRLFLV